MLSPPKKICIAGKNQIAVDALVYMIKRGWKDQLIVCPNFTDNGTSNWQPSLLRFARELGVEAVPLETVQETEDLLFISLEFDRIIKPSAFRSNRLYNMHFSALPAYKGMYTSSLPLLHGAKTTGVTLHEIDQGIDTGPIVSQIIFEIHESWTARDLYYAYMKNALELFRDNIDKLVAGVKPEAVPQTAIGSTYYPKSEINYADLVIKLRDTANGIIRQLRGFSFREYQTPVVYGLEVGGWEVLPYSSRQKPGTILDQRAERLVLATIDYDLLLIRSRAWDWFAVTADSPAQPTDPSFINIRDSRGWTPLIRAAFDGQEKLCRRLLKAGADPNRPNTNGTTPLMYSLSGRAPERVATALLEYGANPDQRDFFGNDMKYYHPLAAARLGV